MTRPEDRIAKYERLTPEELDAATRAFDAELVVDRSVPLTTAERGGWERALRRPGRPRNGEGVRVVSVSIERGLLARSDALARKLGVSRASLISRALQGVLAQGRRRER